MPHNYYDMQAHNELQSEQFYASYIVLPATCEVERLFSPFSQHDIVKVTTGDVDCLCSAGLCVCLNVYMTLQSIHGI